MLAFPIQAGVQQSSVSHTTLLVGYHSLMSGGYSHVASLQPMSGSRQVGKHQDLLAEFSMKAVVSALLCTDRLP